ncbi:VOC family protein [Rhodococcus sp. X156]|uniref:VOC family protein n=1 Tax=Rhodococcus sp. X156 TaxID=2499145 RepID=UPI000FDB8B6F|nr:VOC family protein [Rhodococcus sp. X156]
MIGHIDAVVVDCADPAALVRFWSGVLGGQPRVRSDDWAYVDPPGSTRLAFQRVPEAKTGKNRLHLDIDVRDLEVATLAAEALGAHRVGEVQRDVAGAFQVMLDPEGNEWCLALAQP